MFTLFFGRGKKIHQLTPLGHLGGSKGIEVPVDPLGVKGLSAIMKFLGFEGPKAVEELR